MPFQVLGASAIEGIRGLAGESSSKYSCIQIYKALTPPSPPPAYRGATEGPGPPSYVGSSEERPCPDLGLCAPPSTSAGAGAAVEGWSPPPPDDCTCRVKPRLKSPPPHPPCGSADGLPHPCAARGAADGLPHALPCPPPCCIAALLCLSCPPTEGGGGGAAPRRGERGTTLSLTLALSLTPLTQSSSLWLPLCLRHSRPCSALLPQSCPAAPCCPCSLRGGEAPVPGGGWKKNSWKRHTVFSAQPTPGGWGGYANFFLTHMTKNFTKQSRFKAKIVHVDMLTPSLHQCEDYGPGSTCKAW